MTAPISNQRGIGRRHSPKGDKSPLLKRGLLPIEWVKREKTTPSHRPRGASRPGRGSLGGKNPGFRSAGSASARHRSPNPSPQTKSQLKQGQPNSFPTRPDGITAASGCPAPGGMPPWARPTFFRQGQTREAQNLPQAPTRLAEDP
jgi:hypothetical protein